MPTEPMLQAGADVLLAPEVKDIITQAAISTPTTGYALFTNLSVAEWIAVTLGVLQGIYLLRKWWREETRWGLFMKKIAGVTPTSPIELD